MGGSRWSDDDYYTNTTARAASTGVASFDHDRDVKTGVKATACHPTLDPKDLKVRESRDSAAHPNSNAIMIGLDVTGSMAAVIKQIHAKLPTLMSTLTRNNYIPDPQIMFSAIGDATCDRVPLQVGQFESGAEMEGDLSNFFLEGGGGGQNTESYEIFAYVGARKTSIDCLEKRGKKGYAFIIGDELPYSKVSRDQVTKLIGPELEANIDTKVIFKELQEKYTVFFVLPQGASNGSSHAIKEAWQALVGPEHVLMLADASGVSELIAMQVGLCEGTTDVDAAAKDLVDHGSSKALVNIVSGAVSKAYSGGTMTRVAPGTLAAKDSSSVKRL